MNIKFKTLLSLGVVSLVTASSSFPINAASSQACAKKVFCHKTQGHVYINVNGKKCYISLKPTHSHISNDCVVQKPIINIELPGCGSNNPSTPSDKPVTNPDVDNNTNADNNNNNTNSDHNTNINNNNNTNNNHDNSIDNNNSNNDNDNNTNTDTPSTNISSEYAKFQQEVLNLANKERTSRGLNPLTFNTKLSNVATTKSQDMINKNYFDHTSPTYGSPFDMMKQFGISYKTAGENIAMGQRTPEEVMDAWMNSEGHRANILNPNFTELGVGIASNGSSLYWTQMFIGK